MDASRLVQPWGKYAALWRAEAMKKIVWTLVRSVTITGVLLVLGLTPALAWVRLS